MSKKDDYYTHLMDALEVVHAENLFIMTCLFQFIGVEAETADEQIKDWLKRFEDIRRHW